MEDLEKWPDQTEENEPHQSEAVVDNQPEGQTENKNLNISDVPVIPQLTVALGLLVLVFGVTYIGTSNSITPANIETTFIEKTVEPVIETPVPKKNYFDDISLEARAAMVWDVKNEQVIFNKNADTPLPLASVTKLMTALVASELLAPNELVPVSLSALQTEGDSGLLDGEVFKAQDIIDFVLVASSNDGAAALSQAAGKAVNVQADPEAVFVHAMNLRADELGLTRTHFYNSTGLDLSENEAGAYGTARDMARLMAYIISNEKNTVEVTDVEELKVWNMDGAYHFAENTNEIVTDIDGLIASKTGYTELAGGNLVIAFNAGLNRPIVIAVLGSSYSGRFDDTKELVDRTIKMLAKE